jgi:hypothetical protein
MDVKVPMLVRLYAGDVLVAEVDDPRLFSAVLKEILPKTCDLCPQVPVDACCVKRATTHQATTHD